MCILIIVEYILQLRAQVRRGQNPLHSQEPGRYLDLIAYWKEQCKRAQDECNQLQRINVKLERSNHQLSSRTNDTPDSNITPRTSKRKATTFSPTRAKKRPDSSRQKLAQQPVAEAQDTIEHDSDFLDGLGDGNNLYDLSTVVMLICEPRWCESHAGLIYHAQPVPIDEAGCRDPLFQPCSDGFSTWQGHSSRCT